MNQIKLVPLIYAIYSEEGFILIEFIATGQVVHVKSPVFLLNLQDFQSFPKISRLATLQG